MLGFRRDPTALQHTVPESKVRWLGEPLGGSQYGRLGDKEYAVDTRAAEIGSFVSQAGEILVGRRTRELVDGSPLESTRYHRGFPVKPGTYAELVAKAHKPAGGQTAEGVGRARRPANHAAPRAGPDRGRIVGIQAGRA